jgi:NAD+ dependent glucose-6-phosphate dehydrogenase
MSKTVVITGAAGNIGTKLCQHFGKLGWSLRLLDTTADGPEIKAHRLDRWNADWVREFAGADAVVHLAGVWHPFASWSAVQQDNIDLTMNVFEAAASQQVRRVVFASSTWTMFDHRFGSQPLTTDLEPAPLFAYGASKLFCERLGRLYADRRDMSVICLRIGYCAKGDNIPDRRMAWGAWGQQMWLSNRDLCQGFEKAVIAPDDVRFATLNLMSDNPGMRWDIESTRHTIGYSPSDAHVARTSLTQPIGAALTKHSTAMMKSLTGFIAGKLY